MTRLARLGTAGVLAAGLGAGALGVASAATPSPGSKAAAPAAKAHHHRDLLKRALHGTIAVNRKGAVVTVAVQRGVVTAVTASSVTLKSKDGFVGTYSVTKDTKVRAAGAAGTMAAIKVGSHAAVTAVKSGSTLVASRLVAHSGAARPAPSTSPTA